MSTAVSSLQYNYEPEYITYLIHANNRSVNQWIFPIDKSLLSLLLFSSNGCSMETNRVTLFGDRAVVCDKFWWEGVPGEGCVQ